VINYLLLCGCLTAVGLFSRTFWSTAVSFWTTSRKHTCFFNAAVSETSRRKRPLSHRLRRRGNRRERKAESVPNEIIATTRTQERKARNARSTRSHCFRSTADRLRENLRDLHTRNNVRRSPPVTADEQRAAAGRPILENPLLPRDRRRSSQSCS